MGKANASPRLLQACLLLLFLLSGASGLIYEVVWLRMLIRAFGVTVYAVSTVLVVYMSGLAIGSLLAGRWMKRMGDPLLLYGAAEVGIALTAMLSTLAMGYMPAVLPAVGAAGAGKVLLRLLLAGAVLLPPTVLMGATLPILAGVVGGRSATAGRRVGYLYGANTLGAVVGVLASGFVLLGLVGEWRTALIAASINVLVGCIAFALARMSRERAEDTETAERSPESSESSPARLLLWVYAGSGLCLLVYQVAWSRLLGVLIGNSVYGFASMLAVYLAGIALGSLLMSRFVDRVREPALWVALGLGAIGFLAIASILVINLVGALEASSRYLYSRIWSMDDFKVLPVYAAAVVLPATLVSGALFPLLTRLLTSEGETPRAVGRLYAANTFGAIAGSVLAGFVLIPLLGTLLTLFLTSLLAVLLGVVVLLKPEPRTLKKRVVSYAALFAFGLVSLVAMEDPILRMMRLRLPPTASLLAYKEDRAANVAAVKSGNYQLFLNGLLVSGTGWGIGRMFVGIPKLFHPKADKALLVGLGTGEAFGAGLRLGMETTVVELVPSVVEFLPLLRPHDGRALLTNPRGRIVEDDGRNYLLSSDERFDIILVDISPPIFSPGAVNFYTMEFLELARSHLTQDGIFVLWVPSPCFEGDFWSIVSGMGSTFDQVMVWAQAGSVGSMILGSKSPKPIFGVPDGVLAQRLQEQDAQWGEAMFPPAFISGNRFLVGDEVRRRAEGYTPVTDDRPYTEFPLSRFWRGEAFHMNNKFLFEARP